MTFLLDVNVLMALLWENHEHHQVARIWLRQATGFATCPVSQLGFARVSSHPSLGYSMSPDQAFKPNGQTSDHVQCHEKTRNRIAMLIAIKVPSIQLCSRNMLWMSPISFS